MIAKPSDIGGLFSCRRVVVVGANGAGKTWFALRLGEVLELPVTHNDALALTTGWAHRNTADIQVTRDRIAMQRCWLIEGGPSVLSGAVLERAEGVIWLDMPRKVRLGWVLWRSVRFVGRVRPEHPTGNRDWPGRRQLRFIVKTWTSDRAMRHTVVRALEGYTGPLVHLTSPQAVQRCLQSLKGQT